jgi:hypothetical protein
MVIRAWRGEVFAHVNVVDQHAYGELVHVGAYA